MYKHTFFYNMLRSIDGNFRKLDVSEGWLLLKCKLRTGFLKHNNVSVMLHRQKILELRMPFWTEYAVQNWEVTNEYKAENFKPIKYAVSGKKP